MIPKPQPPLSKLAPIFVNVEMEHLIAHPNHPTATDESVMTFPPQHARCGGITSRKNVAHMLDVIYCGSCGLRVHILTTTKTYGEMRRFFMQFNPR